VLLNVKSLTVHYDGVQGTIGVCIDLVEGGIAALVGANGAGKSTILRAISGLIAPTSGEIWFQGERIDGLPPHEIVRRGIVQVPEGRRLFPYMTVLANLRLGTYLRKDRDEISKDLEKVFERFPILKERKKQQAGTLSGGEQQMLAIARALLEKPVLLMLDEPSLGLAPMVVQEIARIIKEINQQDKVSIILVEQNAYMALSLADKAYVLEVNKITLEGMAKDLLNNEYVKKAYLGG
jgi:branched-chain amino acid transport system ATP-binding protein